MWRNFLLLKRENVFPRSCGYKRWQLSFLCCFLLRGLKSCLWRWFKPLDQLRRSVLAEALSQFSTSTPPHSHWPSLVLLPQLWSAQWSTQIFKLKAANLQHKKQLLLFLNNLQIIFSTISSSHNISEVSEIAAWHRAVHTSLTWAVGSGGGRSAIGPL